MSTKQPKIGKTWNGDIYAGIAIGEDGQPDAHVILLPDAPTKRMTHADATKWAEGLGDGASPDVPDHIADANKMVLQDQSGDATEKVGAPTAKDEYPHMAPASEEDMKVYKGIADNYKASLVAAPTANDEPFARPHPGAGDAQEGRGSMTPDKQLDQWCKGISVHNPDRDECCPDFSCCNPEAAAPMHERILFRDRPELRDSMLMGFLVRALAGKPVHIAGSMEGEA